MNRISTIAILSSGGDAPGINACIRAIVKTAWYHGWSVIGIRRGFEGLIEGDFIQPDAILLDDSIRRGGTLLQSSRSDRFKTREGRAAAYWQLKNAGINAVIMIGGDGSMAGAAAFTASFSIPWIGVPKTIDNDITGTDNSIGFDTALNTAMEAIDRIRDTAGSHRRIHFVEVMGRSAGFIAWNVGIATGAATIFIPETVSYPDHLSNLPAIAEKGPVIVIVAEGDEAGGAHILAQKVKERHPGYDMAVSVLGYIQRGGSPCCSDRILATRLGIAAVNALHKGIINNMVGQIKDVITYTPLENITRRQLTLTAETAEWNNILSPYENIDL